MYVNVWRAASGFDAAQGQPLTWLTSIARNRAIDSLRRVQTQPRLQSTTVPRTPTTTTTMTCTTRGRRLARPARPAEPGLGRARFVTAWTGLGAQQRQSVALAFYDGLSHAEVAAHLRQPLGTVKSWVRRALLSLKSCLDRALVARRGTTGWLEGER